jgi:hypothetical protein
LQQPNENRAFLEKIQFGFAAVIVAAGALNFQDHLGRGINIGPRVNEITPDCAVSFIGKASPQTSLSLDDDAVPDTRKLGYDFRDEGDSPLSARDLARNSNQHFAPSLGVIKAPLR